MRLGRRVAVLTVATLLATNTHAANWKAGLRYQDGEQVCGVWSDVEGNSLVFTSLLDMRQVSYQFAIRHERPSIIGYFLGYSWPAPHVYDYFIIDVDGRKSLIDVLHGSYDEFDDYSVQSPQSKKLPLSVSNPIYTANLMQRLDSQFALTIAEQFKRSKSIAVISPENRTVLAIFDTRELSANWDEFMRCTVEKLKAVR